MNRRTILVFLTIAAIALLFAAGAVAEPHSEKVTLRTDRTVNIRSGPGTEHRQIGEAYPGVSLYFTGTVINGYYEILYPSAGKDPGYVTAYVMESLASVSPVSDQDTILSSSIDNIKVKENAQVYLDAALHVKSKGKISDYDRVPYAGVSACGSYAVLLNRTNDKGEEVLWIGFISRDDLLGLAEANRSELLDDIYVMEGRGIGRMTGVAQTPDGTLFTAYTSEETNSRLNWEFDRWVSWAVFLDRNGNEAWSLADEDGTYRSPTVLLDGGFSLFHQQGDDQSIITLDRNGQVIAERLLPSLPDARILPVGDGFFVAGNTGTEWFPFLARFGGGAEPLWSIEYPHEYRERQFYFEDYAMDSLIISASTLLDYDDADSRRGSLYRMDADGNVLWSVVFEPELDDETHTGAVCVSEDGIIAANVYDAAYNEDYGYNIDFLDSVVAMNMDGEVLWKYKLNDGVSDVSLLFRNGGEAVQDLVPVQGGFLCVGSSASTACSGSGLSPIEWMLFLDKEGNAKGEPVDIWDDRVEIEGVARGADGKAILYGSYIEGLDNREEYEYGDTPGKPFFAVLDF